MSFEEVGALRPEDHLGEQLDSQSTLHDVEHEVDGADELDWLMSLALDDELDANEAARLETLLRQTPKNMERWATWQALDNTIHQTPSALPPVDFGEKFARRLEIQERQRRLRTGVIFGVAAAALWGSALVGLVMLGALVWSNQGALFGGAVQGMAYWWVAIQQFGQVFADAIARLWIVPETRVLVACYVIASVTILAGWFVWLRRSTHEMPVTEPQLVEA
jgi:anti-sigma factor RsiW